MKRTFLSLIAVAAFFGTMSETFAATQHHHLVCHKVHVHHHWVKRCR
ncbi:hypothetical protein WKR88_00615 [Trinickia caryophylli]|uniref:Uncharacterized protein n=1 Tax=Trinickia caryophylli TaxID=28094 RepID=A0A1X7CDV7_TRICW|nr:hypothetical protein [Trinickia caryophylli]WQE12900.1 hypothetical protein U0034_05750 [Trinickia caryophylli]SME95023.1 hypothetical protein SAMN06295900_101256 [Trinickia caryophylli]